MPAPRYDEVRDKAATAVALLGSRANESGLQRNVLAAPKKGWVKSGIGLYCRPERLQEAIRYYDIAQEIFPTPTVGLWKALAYEALNKREMAISAYEALARLAAEWDELNYQTSAREGILRCQETGAICRADETITRAMFIGNNNDLLSLENTPCTKLALEFATLLSVGKFKAAHELIATPARSTFPPEVLESTYEVLICDTESPATVAVLEVLGEWPDQKFGEIGWAYVAIIAGDFNEGLSVVVTDDNGDLRISDIEWGRP